MSDVEVCHLQSVHLGELLVLLRLVTETRHCISQLLKSLIEAIHPLPLPGVGISPPFLHSCRSKPQLLQFPGRQRLLSSPRDDTTTRIARRTTDTLSSDSVFSDPVSHLDD